MVMFWIAAAVLSLGVAALVLRPLLGRSTLAPRETNPDLPIYRSQLKELERDVASGAIGEDEAKSARAEISRRLLGASDEEQMSSSSLSSKQRIAVVILVCLAMPSLATLVYLQKGNPNYTARPYSGSNGEAQMWVQYGRAYMQTERFEDAEDAFQQAIELSDPRADLFESLGEAIILGGDGSIPNRAVAAFKAALELEPARERSRFIVAEWTYRSGDRETGVRGFIDVLEDTKDESLQVFLKERIESAIEEMKAELSGDPAAQRPEPQQAASPLADMSEIQRTQIKQMVAGLAERLEAEPDNLKGWLRLIRSYTVLQEVEKAKDALQEATFTFMTRREDMEKILALAEELELAKGPELPAGAEDLIKP